MGTEIPPTPVGSPAAPGAALWRLRLLGGFHLAGPQHELTRLSTRAGMALLARIALSPQRDHAREELCALLWPDADAASGRNRLRNTLSTLKAVLEPPGAAPVIAADRRVIRLLPGALWCDAVALEAALRQGRSADAGALDRGELMPGFYDEWILEERARLQGLAERSGAAAPEAPAPATASPPSQPAPGPAASRLPQYLTRLYGAEEALAGLQQLIARERFVTVVGPGGAGKTRLAVEAARRAVEQPAADAPTAFERALFVSLVDVNAVQGVFDRLLGALRVESAGDPLDRITTVLHGRPVLLLLDNAEQIDDGAVQAVARLAEALPLAHWLVTSRRPLAIDGEHTFPAAPLAPPPATLPLAELAGHPAVLLFVDRARAHRPDFQVTEGNRVALCGLLAWLEGLPLAIELAAAQVRRLAPADLLALLEAARAAPQPGAESLSLLARRSARSGSDPRQASMLGVVAWSWQLLSAEAAELLRALCLLPAGSTRDWAASLVVDEGRPAAPARAQRLLDELADHSVVRLVTGADGLVRHVPYEPVREYGLVHTPAAVQHALRGRILATLLHWARTLPPTPPLPTVREELPNVASAMAWAGTDGRADRALRVVLWLQVAWGEIALPGSVLASVDALLEAPGVDDSVAAAAHALASTCHHDAGRQDRARYHLDRALARPCPDPSHRSNMLSRSARMVWRLTKDAARTRAMVDEALPLAIETGRTNTQASLLSLLGHLATVADRDPVRGGELSRQSLELWRQSGNRHLINAGRYNVATAAVRAGRAAEMLDEFEALTAEGLELQDWDLASGALEARGGALLRLKRYGEAWADLRRALVIGWDGLEVVATVYALWKLPPVLARLGHGTLAAETMAAAEAQWQQRFGAPDPSDARDLKQARRLARALIGPAATEAARARGRARSLPEAVQAVLAVPAPGAPSSAAQV